MEYPFSMQMIFIESPHRPSRTAEVPEFPSAVQGGGIPDDMVMNVDLVNAGTDDKGVIAFCKAASRIADAELLFSKRQHLVKTGRRRGADDVIACQMRQSFVPSEITTEGANCLGCELARPLIAGDKPVIIRLIWIFNVIYDVADRGPYRPLNPL